MIKEVVFSLYIVVCIDVCGVEGLDEVIERVNVYVKVGVDVIFFEVF